MFGLSEKDIQEIVSVLARYPEVEEAVIFGSRAKGNYKTGSDIDIALKGRTLTHAVVVAISGVLNDETLLPYHLDVINFHIINNPDLIEHITCVGKPMYISEQTEAVV